MTTSFDSFHIMFLDVLRKHFKVSVYHLCSVKSLDVYSSRRQGIEPTLANGLHAPPPKTPLFQTRLHYLGPIGRIGKLLLRKPCLHRRKLSHYNGASRKQGKPRVVFSEPRGSVAKGKGTGNLPFCGYLPCLTKRRRTFLCFLSGIARVHSIEGINC